MSTLHLSRLTVSGPDVSDAEVVFRGGLNVIVGPSDTGKTFIAQCIDFMMGAGKRPKEIPEAQSYDRLRLEWLLDGKEAVVFERSLSGGDFRLFHNGEERHLKARHNAKKTDNVSQFLLNCYNLENRKIRTHKSGKTRGLSFRDIARLILVPETKIIEELSPIFSGQNDKNTVEASVFRMLLTGVDDSSVIAQEEPKILRARREGHAQVVDELLATARTEWEQRVGDITEDQLRSALVELSSSIESTTRVLTAERESAAALENKRKSVWKDLREVESRLAVLSELQKRFLLLRKQYESDLERLEAITEASHRLEQSPRQDCAVCGASPEHQTAAVEEDEESLETIAASCDAEADKIRALIDDLQETIETNKAEVASLRTKQAHYETELKSVGELLKAELTPRISDALAVIRTASEQKAEIEKSLLLGDRLRQLEQFKTRKHKTVREPVDGDTSESNVGADLAEKFTLEVEKLLKAWNFPNLKRVTFSEKEQDIVISGQKRASHGKGVRAITHAAFNLGLLQFCKAAKRPYPDIVLLDSPLIVYRQPDTEEADFSIDVKNDFYRTLAKDFASSQVIILENDPPPDDLTDEINLIEFTGADHGRRGYIPDPS